jgi:DNA polymerase III delta prime subunit
MLQHKDPLTDKIEYSITKYDIKEINASDKNGVDDIRELLETIRYKPLYPSLSKVIVMDEAHQLTTQAQNALLKDIEDTPDHVYFIFCTNNDSKILATLKRRAYIINTHGINQPAIHKLLVLAKKKANFKGDTKELEEALIENEINSPGLILQATERFFSGANIIDCIFGGGAEGSIDTKKLCQLLSKGDFKSATVILKTMTKEDIVMIRNCLLGYFRVILLNSGSVKIAQAMKIIGEDCNYELPLFLANLALASDVLKAKSS